MKILDEYVKNMCSNCKGNCDKGIVFIYNTGMQQVRCLDYEQKEKGQGYIRPIKRNRKQLKPLMR